MRNNKFIWAVLAAAVTFTLLGWVTYDLLLKSFYDSNSGLPAEIHSQVFKADDQMNMGAMIVSNLAGALLLTTILMWGNFTSAMSGAKAAAIICLLMGLSIDFGFLSFSNLFTMKLAFGDIIANTLMGTITGAVIGMVLGKGTSPVTA